MDPRLIAFLEGAQETGTRLPLADLAKLRLTAKGNEGAMLDTEGALDAKRLRGLENLRVVRVHTLDGVKNLTAAIMQDLLPVIDQIEVRLTASPPSLLKQQVYEVKSPKKRKRLEQAYIATARQFFASMGHVSHRLSVLAIDFGSWPMPLDMFYNRDSNTFFSNALGDGNAFQKLRQFHVSHPDFFNVFTRDREPVFPALATLSVTPTDALNNRFRDVASAAPQLQRMIIAEAKISERQRKAMYPEGGIVLANLVQRKLPAATFVSLEVTAAGIERADSVAVALEYIQRSASAKTLAWLAVRSDGVETRWSRTEPRLYRTKLPNLQVLELAWHKTFLISTLKGWEQDPLAELRLICPSNVSLTTLYNKLYDLTDSIMNSVKRVIVSARFPSSIVKMKEGSVLRKELEQRGAAQFAAPELMAAIKQIFLEQSRNVRDSAGNPIPGPDVVLMNEDEFRAAWKK